jgi:hypothetical protein
MDSRSEHGHDRAQRRAPCVPLVLLQGRERGPVQGGGACMGLGFRNWGVDQGPGLLRLASVEGPRPRPNLYLWPRPGTQQPYFSGFRAYHRHTLLPRSTVFSGRLWCGKPLKLRNPCANIQSSGPTVGTPRDLAFSNLNRSRGENGAGFPQLRCTRTCAQRAIWSTRS